MTSERKDRILNVLQHRQNSLAVLLENVSDPHNIAAILRSCDAVGIQDIYILQTEPRHYKHAKDYNYRSSRSANKWVTFNFFDDFDLCMKELRGKYQKLYAAYLSDQSQSLYNMDFTEESTVLIFGNEQNGISKKMCNACDGQFIIPQVGMIKSLNVSVACAVTIYEAYRQKMIAGHYDRPQLPADRIKTLAVEWSDNRLTENEIF